jgi:hypothetical protein
MARIIMADQAIDWIMFANAHRYMLKYPGSQIERATHCNLATMVAGETLFVIGHAKVNALGVNAMGFTLYNGRQFADLLHAHGLRANQRKITLPASCEVAAGQFTGFIYEMRQQLTRHNYREVEVKGAVGLGIGGWATKRVVNPAQRNNYLAVEGHVVAQQAVPIAQANVVIGNLPAHPTPANLANAAQQIFNLVQPFYAALFGAAAHHLLPAGEGYKVSR